MTKHAHLLLDMTGSMTSSKDTALSGVNEYLKSVGETTGTKTLDMKVSVFNSEVRVKELRSGKAKDIKPIEAGEYIPASVTPLYDAMGTIITEMQAAIKDSDQALIIVQTDGFENASREYTKERIVQLVQDREKAGWQFIFLGENLDAMAVSDMVGAQASMTTSYDAASTIAAYVATASSTQDFASGASTVRQQRDLRSKK